MDMSLEGQTLSRNSQAKYLGVWDDDKLTWRDHIASVKQKCFGALAKLQRMRNVLPVDLKRMIFNAFVLPHVHYCSVVWQECTKELKQQIDHERIQKFGMRLILSQPPHTPSDGMRCGCGYRLRSGGPYPIWLSFLDVLTDKHHSTLLNW